MSKFCLVAVSCFDARLFSPRASRALIARIFRLFRRAADKGIMNCEIQVPNKQENVGICRRLCNFVGNRRVTSCLSSSYLRSLF